MKFRLRIGHITLLVSLTLVVLLIAYEGINSYRAYQDTISIIQESEIKTTRMAADLVSRLIPTQAGVEMEHLLADIQDRFGARSLTIITLEGQEIASWPSDRASIPPDADFLQAVRAESTATWWIPGENTLRVGVSSVPDQEGEAFILLREVNLDPTIHLLRETIYIHIATTLAFLVITVLALIWIIWRMAAQPMDAIARVARQATNGDMSPRLSKIQVLELDNIGQGINSLLDRVQTQTAQMESQNRDLESTIDHRTAELRSANQVLELQAEKVSRQASSLQALNRILTAAVSVNNLQELVEVALYEIVTTLRAEYGYLRVFAVEAHFSPAEEMKPQGGAPPPNHRYHLTPDNPDAGLAVPITAQGLPAGRIFLRQEAGRRWDVEDGSFLNLIGQQLSAAAIRIHDDNQNHETNRLMSRLIRVSERLNQQLTFEDMIAYIGSSALDLSGAERGAFFLVGQNSQLTPAWHHGVSSRFIRELAANGRETGAFIPPGDPNPLLVPNLNLLPDRPREWWRHNNAEIRSFSILPLVYEGQLSACLASFYTHPDTPGLSHLDILEAFARQAAIALENARLIEAERQHRELAEALLDVASALNSTLDPDEIFERILVNLERVIHHDAASIMLAEGGELRVVRTRGYRPPDEEHGQVTYPIHFFPEVNLMSQTGQVRIVPDTRADPDWVVTPRSQWMLAYAGAPVRSRGSLIGVINLLGRQPGLFSDPQAPILQAFATQAAAALENARQYQATVRNLDETGSLYRALTSLLTAGGDVYQIADKITRTVTTQLEVGHCAVARIEREHNRLTILSESGSFKIDFPEIFLDGPGLTPLAARTGNSIYIPDVTVDPRYLKGAAETRTEFAIPLYNTSGEIFALINLEDTKINAFDEKTRGTITSFAERAALVLENAGLLDAAREQSRRTTLLNQIAQTCLEANAGSIPFQPIARLIAELIAVDHCCITLWDEERDLNVPHASWGQECPARNACVLPGAAVIQAVMDSKEPVMVADTLAGGEEPACPSHSGRRSLLGFPLIVDGVWLGAILVGRADPGPFSRESVDLLRQAAVQIALGVAKVRLLEATRRRFEESEMLRQATAALTTQLDFDRIISLVAEHLPRLLRFDTLAVFLIRNEVIRPVLAINLPISDQLDSAFFSLDDPIFMQLSAESAPLVLEDAQADTRWRIWGGHPETHSWAAVPLFSGGQLFGTIEIGRLRVDPFSPNDLFLFQVFAHQVGAALQNATLHGIEQQLATTDLLTGLYNRRGFIDIARHEIERSWRFHRPLCLLMADIDIFKQVNDTYGHIAGDAVLVQLADTIRTTLREVDVTCRYGGDEICILLPESDMQGAQRVAERLRLAVQNEKFRYRDAEISITISIGLANLAVPDQTLEDLIEKADRALMVAKQEGRNRVIPE